MLERPVEPADKLHVWLEHDSKWICLHYQIDQEFSGNLELKTSFDLLGIDNHLFHLLGTCGAIFLAQLCLARQVNINQPITTELISTLEPTIHTLYAVRAYRDGITSMPEPTFNILLPGHSWQLQYFTSNRRAILLWSGGLDSTLSHVLLTYNGYEVIPLHASHTNVDAAESELQAVKRLSILLGTTFETVDIQFEQFLDIATRYSINARKYPDVNSVPHGRELLLLPVALMCASKLGASNICFGFENSTWTEQFEYNRRRYSRYDTQSEFCNVNLQEAIHKFVANNVSLFSPIAPITEYRKFRIIATRFPELTRNASFCYWGRSCGVCRKCALYYLFQRSLGLDIIHFKHNPLIEQVPFIMQAMRNWDKPTSRDSNFALAQIVAKGDIRPEEDSLSEYRRSIYPQVGPLLEEWQTDLMTTHPVALLPADFNIPF